jgi:hypothetical protein
MQRLALVSAVLLCSYSYSNAQVSTSCVQSTDGTTNSLNGTQCLDPNNTTLDLLDQGDFGTGGHNTGNSHNQKYVYSTHDEYILHFSYTNDTWVTNLAINQALVGAGFNLGGYTAQWEWKNENTNTTNGICNAQTVNGDCLDDLVISIDAYASGVSIYSEQWDYSQTKSNGYTLEEVLTFSPIALVPGVTIDEIEVSIQGMDNGYWAGMYGPKVKNFHGGVVLMPDLCATNPLSDPSCPGYANALYNQQCAASPLYDPGCPGYAAANLTKQCSANPLYDPSCSGYSTAYYNQQCTNDPTSDPGCPDYYVAMCEADPLFDMGCIGYDIAYFEEQCSFDPQYDTSCSGYVDLSGNDGDYTVLDPLIDDVVNADVDIGAPEFYDVPTESYVQDDFVFTQETMELDDGFQMVEDDIDSEIGELEMIDDIDSELAALEADSGEELKGPLDSRQSGTTSQEDDIEKELEALETANEEETEPVEQEEVQVASGKRSERPTALDQQPVPGEQVVSPADSKRKKLKLLIAMKAIEAVKELETAVTLEQQMEIQRRLLALISFVPDFKDYAEKEQINQVNFYPPKPTVDHAFARWFLNDPNFGAMEDLQYQ